MGSMTERYNGLPFKDELSLISDEGASKIWELKGRNDIIVREDRGGFFEQNGRSAEALREGCKKVKMNFDILRNQYGFNIPNFRFLLANSTAGTGRKVFTVVDRVDGENLLDSFNKDEKLIDRYCDLFNRYCNYLKDQLTLSKECLFELRAEQFMVGRTMMDTEDKIYLVDLDNQFSDDPIRVISEVIQNHYLSEYYSDRPLLRARQSLLELLNSLPEGQKEIIERNLHSIYPQENVFSERYGYLWTENT